MRPTPEQFLQQAEREERHKRRGRLKVFLGYASGVGKSVQMLDEGRRRRERGEDVVVGAVQPQTTSEMAWLLDQLEVIRPVQFAGQDLIDLEHILRRRPQVVLIDGLAYDNPAGSRNAKRYEDVEEILCVGISVITTINLQYITEFQDEVSKITGKKTTQSVPRSFLEKADEIVVVDAPAHDEKLSRLRRMALLLAADVVDYQLQDYLKAHGINETWGTEERILVCITPRSNAERMIQSGRRNADRFQGELYVVYVRQSGLSSDDQLALDRNVAFANKLGAEIRVLEGDVVEALTSFARTARITQIFIGHSIRQGWLHRFKKTTVERLIEAAEGIDVRIFPQ